MFKRKAKKLEKEEQVVEEIVPGWEGNAVKQIALSLRNGGGRPEPWDAAIGDGSAAQLLSVLEKIEVDKKKPLAGVQRRMWALATAWRRQREQNDKLKTKTMCDKNESAKLATEQSLLRSQIQLLQTQIDQMSALAERAVTHVSKINRRHRNKRKDPSSKAVRAFVTKLSASGGWDPASWDGNIWDEDDPPEQWDDDDDDDAGDICEQNRNQSKLACATRPIKTVKRQAVTKREVLPVLRRRKLQRVVPDVREEVRDEQGNLMYDDDGQQLYNYRAQPQPEPLTETILEDYTREEIIHLSSKYRQRQGEPTDLWLARLVDEGASNVKIDAQDGLAFTGLSGSGPLNGAYRDFVMALEGEAATLLEMYAAAVQTQYPTAFDWPVIEGTWWTLFECVRRLVQYTVRDALAKGVVDEYNLLRVSKGTRDALIRTAPVAYKAPVLTVLLGSVEGTMGDVRARIIELGGLGD